MPQYKKWINPLLMILTLVILPAIVFAGPGDPGCPDCPIDGGLSLLLAAGVGLGVKRYRKPIRFHSSDQVRKQ